jgi:hypothetical protein
MKVFFRPACRALTRALLTLAIVLSPFSPFKASAQTPVYDRSGPWWSIIPRPLLSMAYTPEPSDYGAQYTCEGCKYFDSDFYNSDFKLLWGSGGRDDLRTLGQIHANNLHLYDWSSCRDHLPFLNYAQANGLTVWVPFSNYNVENPYDPGRRANIQNIVREIYGLNEQNQGRKTHHPAAVLWGIGNEYDQDLAKTPAANVAAVAKIVVDLENAAGIPDSQKLVFTSPVSFAALGGHPAAIQQILALQQAFIAAGLSDVWYKRFLASTATTNDGAFMDNYIRNTFPAQGDFSKGSGLPLFLSEYGNNGENACLLLHGGDPACRVPAQQEFRDRSQRDYNAAEFRAAMALDTTPLASKTGYFYGFSVFQWQDAFWKCPPENPYCTEGQFGIQKRASPLTEGTIGGGRCGIPVNALKYPVVNLQPKLAWDPTVQAFAP